MAYIDCVVDTEPMARKISTVSDKIKGTTAAVIGMKAAVVQAEADAADHVCENVNRGFYTMIHSQISQKIAKFHSDVDSHLMKLNQMTKQLLAIKDRMQRNYQMISARYIKLFNGLNRNLEQRIYEVDRPIINFALRDANTMSNRKRQLTATVPVSQLESLTLSQKIRMSNLKYRGASVISSMKDFIADMEVQNELTGHILLNEPQEAVIENVMLPIILCESDYDNHGSKQVEVYSGISGVDQRAQEYIRTAAGGRITSLDWEESPLDNEVRQEFDRLLASSDVPKRVRDMADSLFAASRIQTLKA